LTHRGGTSAQIRDSSRWFEVSGSPGNGIDYTYRD
jgi:hypothetical protein